MKNDLFKARRESDFSDIAGRPDYLLSNFSPFLTNTSTNYNVLSLRPPILALFNSFYYLSKQFRQQARPTIDRVRLRPPLPGNIASETAGNFRHSVVVFMIIYRPERPGDPSRENRFPQRH